MARAEFRPDEFAGLKPALQDRFPQVEEMRGRETIIQIVGSPAESPVVRDLGVVGLMFRSGDQATLAQFRIDGFTVNKLPPYSSWDELSPLARHLWTLYCSVAKPECVTRLAVRYINRITIDQYSEILEIMTAPPAMPSGLPQSIKAFLNRVLIQ